MKQVHSINFGHLIDSWLNGNQREVAQKLFDLGPSAVCRFSSLLALSVYGKQGVDSLEAHLDDLVRTHLLQSSRNTTL